MAFLFISIYGSFWKMERTGMMMSIIAMIIATIIKNHLIYGNKISYSKIFFVAFSIVGLFMMITMSRSSVGLDIALNSLSEYMFKSLYTFDKYVVPYEAYGDYHYYFGAIGEKFIEPFYPNLKLDIYVEDFHTVYTYLVGPYIFGGRYLLYFTFYFVGIFYAILYYNVLKRNLFFIVYYSFFSFTIIMSFFSYVYAWNHWIYFAINLIILNFTITKEKVQNERI
jgi:hypothetical protein